MRASRVNRKNWMGKSYKKGGSLAREVREGQARKEAERESRAAKLVSRASEEKPCAT